MDIVINILLEIWNIFYDVSFYVLFGIFFSGLIQIFVKKEQIVKHLGPSKLRSVFWASICGVPLPLCSCGVIPAAISIRKNGASKGATLSFLISTPETGIDSFLISYALLDPIMAIVRPIAAFVTAMCAGILENIFGKKEIQHPFSSTNKCEHCEKSHTYSHTHSLRERFKIGMRFAFVELLGDIGKWLLLGIVIAGVISYFVPKEFIEQYLGQGLGAMCSMLIVGIPLYICASASTPIVASLLLKGMSPGVALVFLLAGPATNAATILMVGRYLGKRAVFIYLFSIASCSLVLGILLNILYDSLGMNVQAVMGNASMIIPHELKLISVFLLVGIILVIYLKSNIQERKTQNLKP